MAKVSISSQSPISLMHVGDSHSGESLSVKWRIAVLWKLWGCGEFWSLRLGGGLFEFVGFFGVGGCQQINYVWIVALESLLQLIRTARRLWTNIPPLTEQCKEVPLQGDKLIMSVSWTKWVTAATTHIFLANLMTELHTSISRAQAVDPYRVALRYRLRNMSSPILSLHALQKQD